MRSLNVHYGGFLLVLLITHAASAQTPSPAAAADTPLGRRRVEYGVRFGPAFTSLTSVETFDKTVAAAAPEPTLNFGGFVIVNLAGPLSLQSEVLFAAKGHRIHDKDAPPRVTGTGTKPPQADRVILLRYLEVPLLVRTSKRTGPRQLDLLNRRPGAGDSAQRSAQTGCQFRPAQDIENQVTANNLSVVFGAGLQHRRWLVDARVTKGLRNVAVVPEPEEVKTSAFAVLMGVRF